jgi:hypothetical protein
MRMSNNADGVEGGEEKGPKTCLVNFLSKLITVHGQCCQVALTSSEKIGGWRSRFQEYNLQF